MACNTHKTITFDEKVKGWTSFHSFSPDSMIGMNNLFFSFSGGNLHIHHSDEVPRNEYYGVSEPSKVTLMVNDEPSTVKELKAVSQEGNYPWDTGLSAFISNQDNPTQSSIREEEYVKKEGFWYSHARRNENTEHLDSRSTYGIGVITNASGNTLSIQGEVGNITIGDKILLGVDLSEVGVVDSYTSNEITLSNSVALTIPNNSFIIGVKEARAEGGNLRGYTIKVDLEVDQENKVELYALNTEVIKSYK